MKLNIKLPVIFIGLAFIIASCSKTNKEGKMIPKTALAVIHLNTKSLSNKLSWNEIKQTAWFSEAYNDVAVSWAKKLMDNPDSTGIDFSSGLVFFVQKPGGTDGQIVLEGDIKNGNTFEAFNKNLTGNTTAKGGNINTLTLPDQVAVGWNDDKFIYVINAAGIAAKMKYPTDALGNKGQIDTTQSLINICKNLFSLSDDNSLAKNEKFASLFKEDGDIRVWQNNEEIVKSSAQLGALSMLKLDVFLKGNVSTATISFDNGQVNVKQKSYVSPELTDVLKKYFEGNINTDMIKHLPSQNINGLLALHFKPEGIKELIKLTGMDGFANEFLQKNNLTIDDLVNANKGDILLAVTDFVIKKDSMNMGGAGSNGEDKDPGETNNFTYEKPDANFLFSAGIGDKTAFNKLMSAFTKMLGEFGANQKVFYANDDKLFAVGGSQQYVSKYIAGSNNKFEFADKISGHPFALFVDIQKILTTAAAKPSPDSSTNIIMNESLKTWQTAYCAGGEYKDDGFVLNTEVNFVDKNTNSLKQLNSYLDKVAKVMIEKEKKNKQRWQSDSTEVYPPMPMDTLPANP